MVHIEHFFDPATFTLTFVVHDPASLDAVVIDPVLDYDPLASKTSTASLDKVGAWLRDKGLRVHYALETHAHADHLSGSQWLRRHFGAKVAISERIREVQSVFKEVFDLPNVATDGSQFDHLLRDEEILEAGTLRLRAIATPGHTPACMSFLVEDALFSGDSLFIDDLGTGRCDFPRGSAEELWSSIHERLYNLPDETRVFPGHDYPNATRPLSIQTTIGKAKRENAHLRAGTPKAEYVALRKGRDAMLTAPRLLYPSIQVNIEAGRLPSPHANGRRYLALPINLGRPTDESGGPVSA